MLIVEDTTVKVKCTTVIKALWQVIFGSLSVIFTSLPQEIYYNDNKLFKNY
jgi:hypothetical protein